MHSPVRTRQSARKATLAAQAAALVLLVGGGVMAYTGLPGLDPAAPEPPPLSGGETDQGDEVASGQAAEEYTPVVDPETVDGNLSMVSNSPEPPVDPVDEPGGEDMPPETATVGIRYVGSIKVGGRGAAFLNIGGITKLLRPGGASFEGVQLVRVEEDEIVISVDGGIEQTIEKSMREGSGVSVVAGGAPKPAETSVVDGDEPMSPPRFTPDMSREERRAVILERSRRERDKWERDRGQDGGPAK
ncbi:hypothetical protein MNBD_PLANCTO03-531 [hydrothermal vent metagenome]|uniref:Type II secretion system protein GspC N-terminal domain-containing protein n=1 Tax=hydrothermal vent metagenome TaxID=652676 RepID=A0A3B1E085_9ZZZZ